MVYTSFEIIQQCNLPIAILPIKLLLPMYKSHLVCLNILCILAKQERHNFSTYIRLPLHIYTNIHKHKNMLMHACKHTSACCLCILPFYSKLSTFGDNNIHNHRNMSMHTCLQTYKHLLSLSLPPYFVLFLSPSVFLSPSLCVLHFSV